MERHNHSTLGKHEQHNQYEHPPPQAEEDVGHLEACFSTRRTCRALLMSLSTVIVSINAVTLRRVKLA